MALSNPARLVEAVLFLENEPVTVQKICNMTELEEQVVLLLGDVVHIQLLAVADEEALEGMLFAVAHHRRHGVVNVFGQLEIHAAVRARAVVHAVGQRVPVFNLADLIRVGLLAAASAEGALCPCRCGGEQHKYNNQLHRGCCP